MVLYSNSDMYKLYGGSMLDMLDNIDPCSIDSIVTDPPYEINFMNKSWDNSGIAFQKSTWERCFSVLKPGGYLLAFGAPRTFHRLTCAIEDAGFEIRDTIMWMYGCYSEDTQVLTDSGWKYFYELDKTEKILQWDKDTNELSWVRPLNYFEYDVDEDMCLFENRHISQLVTKNHKVAVSIKKRRKEYESYDLVLADELYENKSWTLKFPMAGMLSGDKHEDDAYIIGWWLTDAWKHSDGKAVMFSQSKPKTLEKLRNWFDAHKIKYTEYVKKSKNANHKDEHTFYVVGDIANKLLTEYPNRELIWDMLSWDIESRKLLLEGLMDGDGSYKDDQYARTFWSMKSERLDIFQAICVSLGYRAYINNKYGVEFNIAHNSTEIQHRHRKPYVHYKGKVYCLQTMTGAFVVRRNNRAFISGNSGFPKSMNVGTALDKKLGVESELGGIKPGHEDFVGRETTGHMNYAEIGTGEFDRPWMHDPEKQEAYHYEKIPSSEIGKRFSGFGTALKPAYEPIIVARKPLEGTCADNVIKYGVGGINIDDCRIPFETTPNPATNPLYRLQNGYKTTANANTGDGVVSFGTSHNETNPSGRFPANVILTYDDSDFDEVCGGFPDTKSGKAVRHNSGVCTFGGDTKKPPMEDLGYDDGGGSAARYFYCAKASKRDRDEGCVKNFHTTVKPTSLMQYLVRLVTPMGGTVLDPFMGSGSTGKAVAYENNDRNANYRFIGVELNDDYLNIAKSRIDYAMSDKEKVDLKSSIQSKPQQKDDRRKLF